MKAQTQALTTVLITTVIVGAASSTYLWGAPKFEKSRSNAQISSMEASATDIYEATKSVSESGPGTTRTVELSISQGQVEVNGDEDFIQIEHPSDVSAYTTNWQLLRGGSLRNATVGKGTDYATGSEPGIVGVRSTDDTAPTDLLYRIDFRNVRDEDRLERIDLNTIGGQRANGEVSLTLTNRGTETVTGYEISTGETFEQERTKIEVDLK